MLIRYKKQIINKTGKTKIPKISANVNVICYNYSYCCIELVSLNQFNKVFICITVLKYH